ncbi:HRDC domain-containing protein [Bifidobacterium sp.]|uniref:HRDC domain-containing protein n=1 Tax=Bifidobacterium sp. TaxID=41200 RepID=UPI0039E89499
MPRLLSEPRAGVPDVIFTHDAFERMCERFAQGTGSLAADAERASGFRYGHEDWLVQFKREGSGIALVDPIALAREDDFWSDFNNAIGDATWIIHDSLQDLPGFTELGMEPKALFDSEMAARMLGLHHFGLAAVTEHYLDLTLAKEHSAADWSYRPLPRDWRNYAALDVELLIPLEREMRQDLERQGKSEWAEEEFAYLLDKGSRQRQQHPQPWRRVSHITSLHNDHWGLAIVRALWTERDRLARLYDIAPSLLLSDASIIEAARQKPHNAKEFRAIRSINQRVRMHTGGEQDKMFERYAPIQRSIKPAHWKDIIQKTLELPPSDLPVPPVSSALSEENNAPHSMKFWREKHPRRYSRLMAAKAAIAQISQDTQTPIDVILKPQYLRNLCWTDEPERRDVAEFLARQGARSWQIELVDESVSRAIM